MAKLLCGQKKCENSFQELKKKLTTSPVLALPDPTGHFVIFCDASKMGLGCVLMRDRRVVAYSSRQLRTQEKFLVIIRVSNTCLTKRN